MNVTVLKVAVTLLPVGMILCGSAILFFREKATRNLLQPLGASCLSLVATVSIFIVWSFPMIRDCRLRFVVLELSSTA